MKKMKDRRKLQRYTVAIVANITPSGIQTTTEVVVRDLSTGGMGASGDRLYLKGDVLIVKIKFETSPREIIEETITGRVVWAKKLRPEFNRGKKYAFGVRFRELETLNPRLFDYIKAL